MCWRRGRSKSGSETERVGDEDCRNGRGEQEGGDGGNGFPQVSGLEGGGGVEVRLS